MTRYNELKKEKERKKGEKKKEKETGYDKHHR